MPTETLVYKFRSVGEGEKVYWDVDRVNIGTIENQFFGLFTFVGGGIVNGWEVLTVTQDEVDALSDDDRAAFLYDSSYGVHYEACMIVKVTAGDGVIGVWAAYTPEDVYIAFPLRNESIIYYVYATETDCLKDEHRAQIVWNTDSDWDSDHTAIFLGRVITYYDDLYDEVYVFQIPEDTDRRRVLRDLEGPSIEAARDVFFRHVHSGEPDTTYQEAITGAPSKIQLGTQDVENLDTVPASTIFLFDPFRIAGQDDGDGISVSNLESLPEYEGAKVKLNGEFLSESSYHLDNIGGKLYLRNSIEDGDIVQIIKYLDPADTQIARGPQDDPPSGTIGWQPPIVSGDDALIVHPDYKLPGNRVGEIDASKFVFGTMSINRISPIDHYGLNRIRETAASVPATLTRTRDQYRYYLVPPGTVMAYDTEVQTTFQSGVIGDVVSLPTGLYRVSNDDYHDLTRLGYNEDEGRIIRIRDNTVLGDSGGEDRFHETYALTDQGDVWVTQDGGSTWDVLQVPAIDGLIVNCFTVSTDKVEREVNNRLTYDYYKILHIGTNVGMFTARYLAAKGNMMGGSDLVYVETIPWVHDLGQEGVEITALQEIITIHIYATEDDTRTWYDHTLYIGTEIDVRVAETSGTVTSARVVTGSCSLPMIDAMWCLQTNNNGIMMLASDAVYVSHTAAYVVVEGDNYTETYWKHPLTDVDEELHLSYDFSTAGRTANRLSQERGRGRYLVGLDLSVAISTTDQMIDEYGPHQPFLPVSMHVQSQQSCATLPIDIVLTGSGHSVSMLPAVVHVLSLANVADEAAKSDAEKELADGWAPLSWTIPSSLLQNVRDVVTTETTDVIYDPIFGGDRQPTEYVACTDYGVWQSTDGGATWSRPMLIWQEEIIPLVTRNDSEVVAAELTYEPDRQSIRFSTLQRPDAIIKLEKDFVDYYASGGGWEQSTADLIVYVNGQPSYVSYVVDRASGKFTFADPLSKDTVVSFSVVQPATYVTDVGEMPHSEVLQAFVIDEDVTTKLAADLGDGERTIKVISTDDFPAEICYISIEGETIRVQVKDDYTFRALDARPDRTHQTGVDVYLVNVERQIGIEDLVVRAMGGHSYNWSSIGHDNLVRLQLALRRVWSNMFDGIPGSTGRTLQETLHIDGVDALDTTASSSTLWDGLEPDDRSETTVPRVISAMKDPGGAGWIVGTDAGLWRFDGTEWAKLSDLDGAGFIHYVTVDRRDYLIVGADNGLWISTDDGDTWESDDIFFQQQFGFLKGSIDWHDGKTYELYGKEDGMTMIVYGWDGSDDPESFRSDHFDPVDEKRVYGFYQGVFYRINEDTGERETYQSIWVFSEEGCWVCYSGARPNKPRSLLINGREAPDPGTRASTEGEEGSETGTIVTTEDLSINQRYIVSGYDDAGDPVYQKLRFYGAFQDSRPKTIPLIFMTNDGLRVARNWRWVDPQYEELYLFWEATPLSTDDPDDRVICNCYATGSDDSIDDDSDEVWMKYKCFVGTSHGVYRSYNGCYDVEPCQRISGVTSIYALDYVSGRLWAGTDNGIWYSDNDGDDWSRPAAEVSDACYFEDGTPAQTFVPSYGRVTKVSVLLHPKG